MEEHVNDDKSLFGHKLVVPISGQLPPTRRWSGHPAGITSLPTELLLWVFNLLSSASKRSPFPIKHYTSHIKDRHLCDCSQAWAQEDIPSRCTLFPYAHAKVCVHWQNVLALQPEFWTRIIASRKPGEHTPPTLLEDYLRWSCNLPIEVYIGNVRDVSQHHNERVFIQKYTELLRPHIHRCRVIDYEVQYATSLPSLLQGLGRISSRLESLKLKSEEILEVAQSSLSDEDPNMIMRVLKNAGRRSKDIVLHDLVLDGRNFVLAAKYLPALIANVQTSISIQNYDPALELYPGVDNILFSSSDMLQALQANTQARELILKNMTVSQCSHQPHVSILRFKYLTLIDISSTVLAHLSRNIVWQNSPVSLKLESCDLSHPFIEINHQNVELRNMNATSLSRFFQVWCGGTLTIKDCPALTDEIVTQMSISPRNRLSAFKFPLFRLTIDNCGHNFSMEALKDMVHSRHQLGMRMTRDVLPNYQANWLTLPFIRYLSVFGAQRPISDEDMRFFHTIPTLRQIEWRMDSAASQDRFNTPYTDESLANPGPVLQPNIEQSMFDFRAGAIPFQWYPDQGNPTPRMEESDYIAFTYSSENYFPNLLPEGFIEDLLERTKARDEMEGIESESESDNNEVLPTNILPTIPPAPSRSGEFDITEWMNI